MKPNKRLPKRNPRKAAVVEPDLPPEVAQACEEMPNVIMPDPEAEAEKTEPKHHGVPSGPSVSHTCEKCGTVCTVYVSDPDVYDEAAKSLLFKRRGEHYSKPSLCRWCVNRASREQQRKLA